MKTLKFFSLMMALLIASFSCSDNGTNGDLDINDLEGTWDLVEYKFISQADANKVEDLLSQFTMNMKIDKDGNFTTTVTAQGQTFTQSGKMSTNGDNISSGDPDVTVKREGNKLIFEDTSEQHDFGSGSEAATLRTVFQKR